jgi:hypothetical protein
MKKVIISPNVEIAMGHWILTEFDEYKPGSTIWNAGMRMK